MNKHAIAEVHQYIENESHYCKLLQERHANEEQHARLLGSLESGLQVLDIPTEALKIFKDRASFILWLGHEPEKYAGYELALYIACKKRGLGLPDTLAEKCPAQIISLIDSTGKEQYVHQLKAELKKASLSADVLLAMHRSIMLARTESLLADLLSDIERLGFTNLQQAVEKIPSAYMHYLSKASLGRLMKRITHVLRETKGKMEQELKNIDLYALRLKQQLQELYYEADKGLKGIIQCDVEGDFDIDAITEKTSNLFSRLDRLFLGNLHHLKDYGQRRAQIQNALSQEDELKGRFERGAAGVRKHISELFDEYVFFHSFGALTDEENKLFAKSVTQEFEVLHGRKETNRDVLTRFEKKGLLSVELDFQDIIDSYDAFMRKTIVPRYCGQCFLEIVKCIPPPPDEPHRCVTDVAHLKVLALDGVSILNRKGKNDYPETIKKLLEKYHSCVSILVYDIRGSSYMGIKLHNAAKEQRIKSKFAKMMADIVRKHGGFLLKDTGDGGLVWFADNSSSMYNHLYTESVTGKGTKLRYSIFSGAEFEIIPAVDSAKRAILCARDMVQKAEEFIRANFMHYREWFAEVAERTLELDGITYALLPPEFKSLFRIGVGIASGSPGRDVVFCANSYGDPDLVGPVIADAHLYSTEHKPGGSVIVCDFPTLANLILNIESFEYPTEAKDFVTYIDNVEKLRTTGHGYTLADHQISIVPLGIHYLEELDKKKAIVRTERSDIWLDDFYFYDDKKRKAKFLYEIGNL
jgi:class 3 adenylate cyclase